MNEKGPRLRARMLLLFLLVALLPMVVGRPIALWLLWHHTIQDFQKRNAALSVSLAMGIKETLDAHLVAVAHMAGLMGQSTSGPELLVLRDHIDALAALDISLEACVILDERGLFISAFPPLPHFWRLDYASRPEVKEALETGRGAYSPVDIPPGFSEPMIVTALPLGAKILLGFIPIETLNRKIQRIAASHGVSVILTDPKGVAISHQDPELVRQRGNLADLPPISMALDATLGPLTYSYRGETWLGQVSRLPELGWPLVVAQPKSRAFDFIGGFLGVMVAGLAAVISLTAVVAMVTTSKLTLPLRTLTQAARRLAQGEKLEGLEEPGFQELKELHRAFQKMAKDIEEREKALRASEERYRLVVDNAQDAILIAQDGFLKLVNPSTAQLLGFPPEVLTSKPFTEFIHPEDRALVLERHYRRIQGEHDLPDTYRFRVLHESGQSKWVEIRVVPLTSWEGKPATLSFLTDITRRLAWEKELKESEERYRSLVENSPDGIFMAELPSCRIKFVNDTMCRMLGYSHHEAMSMQFLDVLPFSERERAQAILDGIRTGRGLPREPLSFQALRKDGSSITVQVRAAFVQYQGQEVIQAVVRDVTQQLLLEKQLNHSQRMQALGTLAAGVSHEFNNILAGIRGFAELLGYVIQEGRDYVQEIIASCDRAGSLTRKMLSLARVDASERCPIKVNQSVEAIERLLSQTLPSNIEVRTHLAGGLPFVMADPTQVEQVLLNLALNAKDAMPQGGTITIGTRLTNLDRHFHQKYPYTRPGRFVELYVQDNGVGIPLEHIDRIFEPFFTTKEPGKGTGLGLSVSYSIVKAHNGFLVAESPPEGHGKGSLFRVFVPPMEIPQEPLDIQEVGPPPRGNGERILVADDETRIREILRRALETHGYRVTTVQDGQKAVEAYSEALESRDRFQAVIMDISMPVKDGRAAAADILGKDPGALVIIATGDMGWNNLEAGELSGAKALLRKPFDMADLLRTLGRCLARKVGGNQGLS